MVTSAIVVEVEEGRRAAHRLGDAANSSRVHFIPCIWKLMFHVHHLLRHLPGVALNSVWPGCISNEITVHRRHRRRHHDSHCSPLPAQTSITMSDRRSDIDDYTRVKRRKTMADTDTGSDSDDGGVHLDSKEFGTPEQVKQESLQRKVKREPEESSYKIYPKQTNAGPVENGVKDGPKPAKAEPSETKYNPYLAHMDEQKDDTLGYGNGYGHGFKSSRMNGMSTGTTIGHFPHHETTAAMAKKAEDGPNNPYNGKPLSKQYFNILKTRRNLPVHAQRSVKIQL